MHFERIAEAAILLILVMDPLGNTPLFLSVLERVPPARRQRVLIRELLLALAFLGAFLIGGATLLDLVGIRQESVRIAGGLIIFLIALRMVFPRGKAHSHEDDIEGEPLVVPLAIPLVAGPSALATLVVLNNGADALTKSELGVALLMAWGVTSFILLLSGRLRRVLGRRGLIAMERLMGMLLVALAVQMFLDGLKSYL